MFEFLGNLISFISLLLVLIGAICVGLVKDDRVRILKCFHETKHFLEAFLFNICFLKLFIDWLYCARAIQLELHTFLNDLTQLWLDYGLVVILINWVLWVHPKDSPVDSPWVGAIVNWLEVGGVWDFALLCLVLNRGEAVTPLRDIDRTQKVPDRRIVRNAQFWKFELWLRVLVVAAGAQRRKHVAAGASSALFRVMT